MPPNGKKREMTEDEIEAEAAIPLAIRRMFPSGGTEEDQLSMITETPPHMVMPLVRMKLVAAAMDPKRTQSLLEIFMQEYDRRMVSKGREGRKEFIEIMQAETRRDEDELEI